MLDEQFRADFALINLYTILLREQQISPMAVGVWRGIIQELESLYPDGSQEADRLLATFMSRAAPIGAEYGNGLGVSMVVELTDDLCQQSGQRFAGMPEQMDTDESLTRPLQAIFVAKLVEGVLNAARFEQVA